MANNLGKITHLLNAYFEVGDIVNQQFNLLYGVFGFVLYWSLNTSHAAYFVKVPKIHYERQAYVTCPAACAKTGGEWQGHWSRLADCDTECVCNPKADRFALDRTTMKSGVDKNNDHVEVYKKASNMGWKLIGLFPFVYVGRQQNHCHA